MALFPCLQGGGVSPVETTLWSNSSPTSDLAAQNITLSGDISNYRYIKFVFNIETTTSEQYEVLYPIDTLRNVVVEGNKPAINLDVTGPASGLVIVGTRRITYLSDTSIHISDATGGGGTINQRSILTAVIGVG